MILQLWGFHDYGTTTTPFDMCARRTRPLPLRIGRAGASTCASPRPSDDNPRAASCSRVPRRSQNALITLEWISRHENLVLSGPSGTGKSHFAEALANLAIEKDMRVAWHTLESLSAAIMKSKVDGSIARTVARICGNDLIVVDDIGLLPVGADAAEALYRVADAAYERRSIALTSNIHPSKAHMFARTCVRRRRSSTGSVVFRFGASAPGKPEGFE